MNVMNHEIANLIGVNQEGLSDKVRSLVPGYMAMGQAGMHEMSEMNMGGPKNTLPMMTGTGQFGPISMGGMFTVLKVRDGITSFEDPGWFKHPEGTVAGPATCSDQILNRLNDRMRLPRVKPKELSRTCAYQWCGNSISPRGGIIAAEAFSIGVHSFGIQLAKIDIQMHGAVLVSIRAFDIHASAKSRARQILTIHKISDD